MFYSADVKSAMIKYYPYDTVGSNNFKGIIVALNRGEFGEKQGSMPWGLAFDCYANNKSFFHALNLFIIHELLKDKPEFCPNERIITYLKTKEGRQNMKETINLCFVNDIAYKDKVRALVNNKSSLLYLGIYPHRIDPFSKGPSRTFTEIIELCNEADRQYAAHASGRIKKKN